VRKVYVSVLGLEIETKTTVNEEKEFKVFLYKKLGEYREALRDVVLKAKDIFEAWGKARELQKNGWKVEDVVEIGSGKRYKKKSTCITFPFFEYLTIQTL